MFNMFAGGAVERMAIFALNIMPYISASIIVQLMTTGRRARALKKEGERAASSSTSTPAISPSCWRSSRPYGIAVGLEARQGVVAQSGLFFRISTVITLLAAPCS
jgi:preprotein translocase subunit SecY